MAVSDARLKMMELRASRTEALVYVVPTDADAERLIRKAAAAGLPEPLCIVTHGDCGDVNEPVCTVREMIAVAAGYRRGVLPNWDSAADSAWTVYRRHGLN
jgi:hypothetical protein